MEDRERSKDSVEPVGTLGGTPLEEQAQRAVGKSPVTNSESSGRSTVQHNSYFVMSNFKVNNKQNGKKTTEVKADSDAFGVDRNKQFKRGGEEKRRDYGRWRCHSLDSRQRHTRSQGRRHHHCPKTSLCWPIAE
jgi:hypothetical protein